MVVNCTSFPSTRDSLLRDLREARHFLQCGCQVTASQQETVNAIAAMIGSAECYNIGMGPLVEAEDETKILLAIDQLRGSVC